MLVKNLVSWAGENFHHLPGQEIELDDAAAIARCEAGLAAATAEAIAAARERLTGKRHEKAAK